MTTATSSARELLQAFDFTRLFIEELGWDRLPGAALAIPGDDATYRLQPVAQKVGLAVYRCLPGATGAMPDSTARAKIEKALTRQVREHILIFTDRAQTAQLWQWVRREPGKPDAVRTQRYERGQSGERLLQRLDALQVSLEEEERGVGIVVMGGKAAQAFDVDRVTKRFYERFDAERRAFVGFIAGLDGTARGWYAALMLNRLMFIYFIQKKGFLDGNTDYLRSKLRQMQAEAGADRFLTFYRRFLLRLFHEGLGQQERSAEVDRLLGRVPYLNGGLFDVHQLEREHADIAIPDEAFARVFTFFDAYEWHLDDRPLHSDREINPDVLGYIFEKFINQKQMGAYYTKEDITEYIGKNTIIPYLFTAAERRCEIAFRPDGALWGLLREQPDRYIYEAVRHGVDLPLPAEVAAGVANVAQRGGWNRPATEGYALPAETWRECVARRTRCLEVRAKLAAGEVHAIDDLITLNLNIRQFAQDAITFCEGPELLRAFYEAIRTVTVLDPTCGSGAFLFAALNILEPLYEACLERMRGFIGDADRTKATVGRYADFRLVLKAMAEHPSARYYVLKAIILNNLYGVDIMEEAVEICKLRLFLKLVAQVERFEDIEPLPDIDFNIRAGNTLVGFATAEEVRQAIGGGQQVKMDFEETMPRINARLAETQRLFTDFRTLQTDLGQPGLLAGAKKAVLRNKLSTLSAELDGYLAAEYGITADQKDFAPRFAKWRASHQPFHWLVEFYGVMDKVGFDVVIGNPPYIVYSPDKMSYQVLIKRYRTVESKNLYAFVFERSTQIAATYAPLGFIVQLTVMSSERLPPLQDILTARGRLTILPFPRRPESIFEGVEMPVAIVLSHGSHVGSFATSRVARFYTEERPGALDRSPLFKHNVRENGCRIGKLGSALEGRLYQSMQEHRNTTIQTITRKVGPYVVYYQEACRYWVKACYGTPFFRRNGVPIDPPHGRTIALMNDAAAGLAACVLNSSLFYWYYSTFSDCEHVNDAFVRAFPVPDGWDNEDWTDVASSLMTSLSANAKKKTIYTKQGHTIEYDEMKAALSKPLIDEIDRVLARYYGFSEEELDFIINYDIKYRMGREAEDEAVQEGRW